MVVDISSIEYFAPIIAFLLVFVVLFAVLSKTQVLGESKFIHLFVSFLIASIFVSFTGVREFVLTITPWFAVLLISLLFILVILGFVGQSESYNKSLGGAFLFLLIIVFLVSGYVVFNSYLSSTGVMRFKDIVTESRFSGGLLLIAVSAVVSWILVKSGKN